MERRRLVSIVMAGLGPAIHDFSVACLEETWMAGPSPAMTNADA